MAPPDRLSHSLSPHVSGTGLRGLLRSIDGGPFQAYRRIVGEHELGDFSLSVISVPHDALAGPARVRLSIDRARAGLEAAWSYGDIARVVLEDAIVRAGSRALVEWAGPSPASAPGSGRVWVEPPGPGLAVRTSARVDDQRIDLSLALDLPAAARRVRGQQAEAVLFELLPRVGLAALLFPLRRLNEIRLLIASAARQRWVAGALGERGLAALVPASALPRQNVTASGATTIATPEGPISGQAIPAGITLFVTAGIAGPGSFLRDLVAASDTPGDRGAILARPVATLGASRRAFGPIDLSAFVRASAEVPDPGAYMTEEAPAPLAVAASLVEAVEAGARILVLDEDDAPAEVLAELRDRWSLSFFIAARGVDRLGDIADRIFDVGDDRMEDVTEAARGHGRSAARTPLVRASAVGRCPEPRSMRIATGHAPDQLKVGSWGGRGVRVGGDLIDLSDTTLVTSAARLRAVAGLLKRAASIATDWRPVDEVLDALCAASARPLLDRLEEQGLVDLERPSRIEIAAALVRWKRVAFRVAAGRLSPTAEGPP